MTTADKYDDLAKTAGSAAGLKPEQLPGFAHILRELARSERAEQKEACARVAEGDEYISSHYRTWSWWLPMKDGTRENRSRDSDLVRHCDQISAAIRARGL